MLADDQLALMAGYRADFTLTFRRLCDAAERPEIAVAFEQGDFGPFEELLAVLSRPYDDQTAHARYAEVPEGGGADYRTFCGT